MFSSRVVASSYLRWRLTLMTDHSCSSECQDALCPAPSRTALALKDASLPHFLLSFWRLLAEQFEYSTYSCDTIQLFFQADLNDHCNLHCLTPNTIVATRARNPITVPIIVPISAGVDSGSRDAVGDGDEVFLGVVDNVLLVPVAEDYCLVLISGSGSQWVIQRLLALDRAKSRREPNWRT